MGRGGALTALSLRLGPLTVEGYAARRSGLRWLREDGAICQAGEPIAFCNIGLIQTGGRRDPAVLFADEALDFQAVLAPRVGGRLRHAPNSSRGGFFDMLDHFQQWTADYEIGTLEPVGERAAEPADSVLRVIMVAGRRASNLSEDRSGLLTGWHSRTRAWRAETEGPVGTLLCLGVCDLSGAIRGDRRAFLELFQMIEGPAQVVYTPDSPLVHNAAVILDQMRRTNAERDSIAEDLARTFADAATPPQPSDWIHAGATLQALQASPATETYEVLCREGIRRTRPADAIILSAGSEGSRLLRHRRLGYVFHSHGFRLNYAGPAFGAWVRANFEPVRRSLDDVRADYRELFDLIRSTRPQTQLLICNTMSTSGYEDLQTYAGFDAPLGETVASVRDKDANLMLHDLARERDVAIVDLDAIAAALGGQRSLPDGVHQNGAMQAELRAEILRILRERGVPGFGPPRLS